MMEAGNRQGRNLGQAVKLGRSLLFIFRLSGIVCLLLLVQSCTSDPKPATPPTETPKKEYLNHTADAHYVGKQACKSCHQDKFGTFVHSEMGSSFKPAKACHSVAKLDGVKPVYDKFSDLYYLPFHIGEDMYLREFRLAGRDTVHLRTEKIA